MTRMENSRYDSDEVEIDLGEILALLLHKAWLILLCALLAAMAGFGISKFLITEQFESTTKVYILSKQNNNTITYSDVQLGSQLTKDYTQLIKSRKVLEKVIADGTLTESYESFSDRISVTIPTDTRIISITVTDEDPLMAQYLADEIRKVASEQIKNVMDIQAVNVVDEANLPKEPSSPSIPKWTAIAFLIGGVLCAAIILVHYMLDDTIKTSDDVEKYLGLSTLGTIPTREDNEKQKHKKGKHTRSSEKAPKKGSKTAVGHSNVIAQADRETQKASGGVTDDTLTMVDIEAVNEAAKEGN